MLRNVVRTPHFIVASMEKNSNTSRVAKYSRQGIQIKISLSVAIRIKRKSSSNLISCRQKLPTKNPSMKS